MSAPHSKNSHSTPMVMEKQNATIVRYSGDRLMFLLVLFRRSTVEKPTAANRKPFSVCSMVSQIGNWV